MAQVEGNDGFNTNQMLLVCPSEEHPSELVPIIQNIVVTFSVDCELDLKKIALQARNAEYNPRRFSACIMRIREPKTTALIFSSGKMICTGAKNEQDAKVASRKFARIVQKLGYPAKFKDFKILNMVGSCDVKFPLRLESLACTHGAHITYEPELFPGLIYRMKQPKVVLLIFISGKIVLTGAKVREEIYTAFEKIYPMLEKYKRSKKWHDTHNSKCRIDSNVDTKDEICIYMALVEQDLLSIFYALLPCKKRSKTISNGIVKGLEKDEFGKEILP